MHIWSCLHLNKAGTENIFRRHLCSMPIPTLTPTPTPMQILTLEKCDADRFIFWMGWVGFEFRLWLGFGLRLGSPPRTWPWCQPWHWPRCRSRCWKSDDIRFRFGLGLSLSLDFGFGLNWPAPNPNHNADPDADPDAYPDADLDADPNAYPDPTRPDPPGHQYDEFQPSFFKTVGGEWGDRRTVGLTIHGRHAVSLTSPLALFGRVNKPIRLTEAQNSIGTSSTHLTCGWLYNNLTFRGFCFNKMRFCPTFAQE